MFHQTLNKIYGLNIENLNVKILCPSKVYQRGNNALLGIVEFKIILLH